MGIKESQHSIHKCHGCGRLISKNHDYCALCKELGKNLNKKRII